jgi:hypothetical protein
MMRLRRHAALVRAMSCLLAAAAMAVLADDASAAPAASPGPAWEISNNAAPSSVPAGGSGFLVLQVKNTGDASTDGSPVTVVDHLPAGMIATAANGMEYNSPEFSVDAGNWECDGVDTATVTCVNDAEVVIKFPVARGFKSFQPTFYNGWGLIGLGCQDAESIECFPGLNRGNVSRSEEEAWRTQPPGIGIAFTVSEAASGTLTDTATVHGGGAPAPATDDSTITVGTEPVPFGLDGVRVYPDNANGSPDTQSGSHPYAIRTIIKLNSEGEFVGGGNGAGALRGVHVELPPGLVGNPQAYPECPQRAFEERTNFEPPRCSPETQVGAAAVDIEGVGGNYASVPIFSIVPNRGEAARFGFATGPYVAYLSASVSPDPAHNLVLDARDIPKNLHLDYVEVAFWGAPADPSHDRQRPDELPEAQQNRTAAPGAPESAPPNSSGAPLRPFLTLPSQCGRIEPFSFGVQRWQEAGFGPLAVGPLAVFASDAQGNPTTLEGCGNVEYTPTIEAKPTTSAADSPTGVEGEYKTPTKEHEESPEGLAEGELKDVELKLPAGVTVNPSTANGLGVCSEAQIALTAPGAGECPESSKVATLHVETPLLDHSLPGTVYLATQDQNPFHTLLAAYVVIDDPLSGVIIKLPAELKADAETGQLTARLQEMPQYPLSDVKIKFFEDLATPQSCGSFTATSDLTPWSAPETPDATPSASFAITSGVGGSPCPGTFPFAPAFSSETAATQAGAFSPLELSISRKDGEQHIVGLTETTPEGLSAVLRGVTECPEPGAAKGECGPESLIGEASASAGVGSDPYVLHGGKVYLTGPYNDGSFGDVVVIPAVAGPFNLGNVVTRDSIRINPVTAQASIVSDPLPQMVNSVEGLKSGIPTDIRQINVSINRPGFMFNPSSCDPTTVMGELAGAQGTAVAVSAPFQAAGCSSLRFTPTVAAAAAAHATKADGQSLSFRIAYPSGGLGSQAWFNELKLVIPKQLPARLTTLQKACLAKVFETERQNCPKQSIIGKAVVHTQVLPVALEGPVYFVSYGSEAFPDVVMVLSGDNVNIQLTGETLIKNGVTSATFKNLPAVPFESTEVTIPTGEYSEFGADLPHGSYDFCGQHLHIPTEIKASNGLEIHQETPVTIQGACAPVKTLTTAQKLTAALNACHKKHGSKRAACERAARKKYGKTTRNSRNTKRSK